MLLTTAKNEFMPAERKFSASFSFSVSFAAREAISSAEARSAINVARPF